MAFLERTPRVSLPEEVDLALKGVEARLSSFRISDFVNRDLFNPSVHLLSRRGKLLRPTLLLLGAYFLGQKPSRYVDLAVAAELLHVSSLIHDDIIDRDEVRRGIKTVHVRYGNEAALLAGDALIATAVGMSSKYGEEVMKAMSSASIDMCAGELLDYNLQKTGTVPSVAQCLNIDMLKSAALIAACCNVVAVHTNDSHSHEMHLFGRDLGTAFQIRDDIIDYREWVSRGRKGLLVPNVVSSIESRRKMRSESALLEAGRLNEKYVRSALARLGESPGAKLMRDYASLVMVKT